MHIHGVILAAGKGERFGRLTNEVPKALVYVAGKSLLEWAVDRYHQTGIEEVVIAVGWKGPMIEDFVTRNGIDAKVVYVPNYEIGPLQTLYTAIGTFEDDFLLSPVDAMFEPATIFGIRAHHSELGADEAMSLAVGSTDFEGTLVEIDANGLVARIGDVNPKLENTAKSAMLFIAHTRIRESCRNALKEGKKRVVDLLAQMIKQGVCIQSFHVSQPWFDVDTLSDLLVTNQHFLHRGGVERTGSVFVTPGDSVDIGDNIVLRNNIMLGKETSLIGPVLISPNCAIGENCKLGPNVTIASNTTLSRGCEVKDAVIFGESKLTPNTHIQRSVVYHSIEYEVKM